MPSFASIERAYEAAREREHTDLPTPTAVVIRELEERAHAYENDSPNSVESKVLALVTATPGISYEQVLAHFTEDQEFGSLNQDGVWRYWGLIAENALCRLSSGLKLLRIERDPKGYGGLVDNSYFVK
jgi:hypothetical protein